MTEWLLYFSAMSQLASRVDVLAMAS